MQTGQDHKFLLFARTTSEPGKIHF